MKVCIMLEIKDVGVEDVFDHLSWNFVAKLFNLFSNVEEESIATVDHCLRIVIVKIGTVHRQGTLPVLLLIWVNAYQYWCP